MQAAGLFHKVYAFIAPKLIGGDKALGPLGEIGLLKMTDALPLHEPSYDLFGPDMLISGYLPPSGGLVAAAERCYAMVADDTVAPAAVRFYKAWDEYGTLSNFSPHPIVVSHMDPECREWQTVEVRISSLAEGVPKLTALRFAVRTGLLPSPEVCWRADE
jgi:diaminohydroxyphosphoribosylaminopyrimidine deaminase/5-amino-6-(5-phosphoribosylamino)uracil reductase